MEIDAELFGRIDKFDVAFLFEFASKGVEHGFARLDSATREMPAAHIRVLDQEHAALPIDHETTHAERQSARQAPAEVHEWARSARRQESQVAQKRMKRRHVNWPNCGKYLSRFAA